MALCWKGTAVDESRPEHSLPRMSGEEWLQSQLAEAATQGHQSEKPLVALRVQNVSGLKFGRPGPRFESNSRFRGHRTKQDAREAALDAKLAPKGE